MQFIELHTSDIIKSSDFLGLSKDCLAEFLDNPNITSSEVETLQAVLLWAKVQCINQHKEDTGANRRLVLGDLLYKIRLPVLQLQEFSDHVAESGLLTDMEELSFVRYFLKGTKSDTVLKHIVSARPATPPLILELSTQFKSGATSSALNTYETFKFQSSKQYELFEMELFCLTLSCGNSAAQLSPCMQTTIADIKIEEKYKTEEDNQEICTTVVETRREQVIGRIKMKVTLDQKKKEHQLIVTVRSHCVKCGIQMALRYNSVHLNEEIKRDVYGYTNTRKQVPVTKEIIEGLNLQLGGHRIVKTLRLRKIDV